MTITITVDLSAFPEVRNLNCASAVVRDENVTSQRQPSDYHHSAWAAATGEGSHVHHNCFQGQVPTARQWMPLKRPSSQENSRRFSPQQCRTLEFMTQYFESHFAVACQCLAKEKESPVSLAAGLSERDNPWHHWKQPRTSHKGNAQASARAACTWQA